MNKNFFDIIINSSIIITIANAFVYETNKFSAALPTTDAFGVKKTLQLKRTHLKNIAGSKPTDFLLSEWLVYQCEFSESSLVVTCL